MVDDLEERRHRRARKPHHDAAQPVKLDYGAELVKSMIEHGAPKEIATFSDEEWAAHDARIAAERATEADLSRPPAPAEHAHLERYVALGWPLRALIHAEKSGDPKIVGDVDARRNIAILAGDHGTGKTVASAAWMFHSKKTARFTTTFAFSTSSRFNDEAREKLHSMPLVLDDLGAEYADEKGSFLANLDELIDMFYGSMRPLIITTNLAKTALRARYGNRIGDRLHESARWIPVLGESRRKPR